MLTVLGSDLSCDSMTGGRKELRPALFRSMLSAGVTEGHLYVATPHDDQEKIVSFGLCFAPGNSLFSRFVNTRGTRIRPS